ncbi:MAG: electron transport complex subunit E [Lachnospiraceae bacterium]|nr:electron transport complex subunit E [Candidatus Colinaster equi]
MNKCVERLYNGVIKENPTLVLMLGMCPTLAVTTSAINGLGMGLTTTAVLALSNAIIASLRKIIPDKIRIPAFIVIIASFVTIMQLLLQAYIPSLYSSLGIYIPLIVVNCIILGRAESYAYKNPVLPSFFDGLGMGLGFTCSLTLIGLLREFVGGCSVFGHELGWFEPVGIFRMAPGAFFVLALLTAIQNKVKIAGTKKGKDMSKIQSGCGCDCLNCSDTGCKDRKEVSEIKEEEL